MPETTRTKSVHRFMIMVPVSVSKSVYTHLTNARLFYFYSYCIHALVMIIAIFYMDQDCNAVTF